MTRHYSFLTASYATTICAVCYGRSLRADTLAQDAHWMLWANTFAAIADDLGGLG